MKKTLLILTALAALLPLLAACDDGPIHEKDAQAATGKIVKVQGRLTGLKTWTSGYDVSVAGFTAEAGNEVSPYASISKVVTADSLGNVSMVMSAINGNVQSVEVCVLNVLRQRVMTFVAQDITSEAEGDTININLGTLDVSMLAAIQQSVFNASCTACHGGNGRAAAGLDLTAGHSYASLVGHESAKVPGSYRVAPGSAGESVLYQVIDGNISQNWRQNHSDMLNKERSAPLINLVADWINSGAKN